MPEYGDSGDAEWGMFHAWGTWVCALERAGALYQDPGYRWAAVRMFRAACQNCRAGVKGDRPSFADAKIGTVPGPALDAMNSAYALCLADQWCDRRLQPRPAIAASIVTYRREPGNRTAADKLILAPSRQPGAPFVMAELFARWFHAHDDQLGAVLYYEYGDVPLLHGLGYHNRAAEQANMVLLSPAAEPFPHKARAVTPGVWQEASLPAKRLPPAPGGGDRSQRHFDKLMFRVAEDEPVDLFVENLRLSGPKGSGCWTIFAAGAGGTAGGRSWSPARPPAARP